MTSLYMDGFEQYGTGTTGNANMLLGPWASIQSNGSLGVLQTPTWGARTGTLAMTCINTSTSNEYVLPATKGEIFLSLGFSIGVLPTANFQSQICCFKTSAGADIARLWCQEDGSIVITDGSNTVLATSLTASSSTMQPSVWYFFEMDFNQTAGSFTLRINDQWANGQHPAIQLTGAPFGSTPVGKLTFVGCGREQLDWIDDLYIRDTLGTVNSGWLGYRSILTLSVTGTEMQAPTPTTTLISAVQITYEASSTGSSTITSTFTGALGNTATDASHTLTGSPLYYFDIYEADPDTSGPISPITIVNGAVKINKDSNTTVVQTVVLVAAGSGVPNDLSLISWTFVLDGHRFYVISLGLQGDWAYDFTTQEWCQLQSQGFSGINFTHGGMWGLRVIGGDELYPYLYELDPYQPLDESWRNVQHMVTGGIPTRSRAAIGVANFTVTASVGDDASISQPISLAFSDDNGVTWSPEFDVPLTDVSTQSLLWSALGSFAAPGRVFRITDYAGPIRLDGADVVLTIGTGADSGQASDGQRAQ